MKNLNTNQASHSSDKPTNILKQNVDFFSHFTLDSLINQSALLLFPQF